MMAISREQMTQMGQLALEDRLVQLLRECYAAQCAGLDNDQLRRAIRAQATRARQHGLTDERSVALFVNAAWLLGENFDERIPALAQVLAAPELSAAAKARAVDDFQRSVFDALAGEPATGARRGA